uniref:Phosphoesterase, PA-phosphatase related protein n=1 Tax=Chlorobium chlorochromatii (strain CaD3) TaxID=340177 RepID=Q3AS01_CHLCH
MLALLIPKTTVAADGVERAGSAIRLLIPATGAAMALVRHDDDGLGQLAASGAIAVGVTTGLKYAIPATRPDGDDHSFPSMHTAIAFSSAEFIRARYGWNYGIPAYVAATFVGYSRVVSDRHYTRDVLAGALIGIGSSALLTTPYKNVQVQAELSTHFTGTHIVYAW